MSNKWEKENVLNTWQMLNTCSFFPFFWWILLSFKPYCTIFIIVSETFCIFEYCSPSRVLYPLSGRGSAYASSLPSAGNLSYQFMLELRWYFICLKVSRTLRISLNLVIVLLFLINRKLLCVRCFQRLCWILIDHWAPEFSSFVRVSASPMILFSF